MPNQPNTFPQKELPYFNRACEATISADQTQQLRTIEDFAIKYGDVRPLPEQQLDETILRRRRLNDPNQAVPPPAMNYHYEIVTPEHQKLEVVHRSDTGATRLLTQTINGKSEELVFQEKLDQYGQESTGVQWKADQDLVESAVGVPTDTPNDIASWETAEMESAKLTAQNWTMDRATHLLQVFESALQPPQKFARLRQIAKAAGKAIITGMSQPQPPYRIK